MKIFYSALLFILILSSCVTRDFAYRAEDSKNKDDKNYHAKTAKAIISKAGKNKKKHDRKAEKKRRKDLKEATKSKPEKKRVVKNPGPFDFY